MSTVINVLSVVSLCGRRKKLQGVLYEDPAGVVAGVVVAGVVAGVVARLVARLVAGVVASDIDQQKHVVTVTTTAE